MKSVAGFSRDLSGKIVRLLTFVVLLQFQIFEVFAFPEEYLSSQAIGSGGAQASIADDSSAFYLNSAGIGRHVQQRQIFLGSSFFSDWKEWSLRAGISDGISEDPIHFGFLYRHLGTTERKREDFHLVSAFNYKNLILIGLGHQISAHRKALLTSKQWSYGLDAGALFFPMDILAIGASFRNIARSDPNLEVSQRILVGGLSLNFKDLRIGIDAERNFTNSSSEGRIGLEWRPYESATLRGGYFSDRHSRVHGYSLGSGLNIQKALAIDFGYLDYLKSSRNIYSIAGVLTF